MITIRVMIVGDTHGNIKDIIPKIYIAGKHNIQHVVIAGDFGLWTHFADGHLFLDDVNRAAEDNNLTVYAVGGNHENWDHWNWFVDNMPKAKGFAMVRRRVLLAPKVHSWKWAGKQFVSAGGAVSIDKEYRLAKERGGKFHDREFGWSQDFGRGSGARTLYWPNEQLEDDDVASIKMSGIKADYLITHDCSNHTPFGTRLKPDADSDIHRRRIDEVLKATEPQMHWHGHMHEKYDWVNDYSGSGTRTLGLEAFQDFNSWGVLDVEDGVWMWPSEFYAAVDARAERKRQHDEERGASFRPRSEDSAEKMREENETLFKGMIPPI